MDDPFDMDGPRFFRLAVRLPYYEGAMRIVALGLAGDRAEGRDVTAAARPAPSGQVLVNLPGKTGRGPEPLPPDARYTDSDQASLMANPVFRDLIEFGRG